MSTRSASALLVVAVFLLSGCKKEPPPAPPPPPSVKVAEVVVQSVPVKLEIVGQTLGSQEVEIRARVEGFLATVNFQEGTLVKEGDLLFTIDPAPFEKAVAEAEGQIGVMKARLDKANQDVERLTPLVAANAVPKQDLDNAKSMVQGAQSSLDAAIAAADQAKINLGYTKISSPVTGLVGKTEVKPGNLVGRGESTLLAKVAVIDPIHVRVKMSEKDYIRLSRKRAEAGQPTIREGPGTIDLVLADGSMHPHKGKVVFADSRVDPATGTLLLELAFPNPDRLLRPGQYGKAVATTEENAEAVLVPQRAVIELQGTTSVAVLDAGDVIRIRGVKMGVRVGPLWVVDEGLAKGDRIVVEGLQKARDGTKVIPVVVKVEDLFPAGEEGRSGGK